MEGAEDPRWAGGRGDGEAEAAYEPLQSIYISKAVSQSGSFAYHDIWPLWPWLVVVWCGVVVAEGC